MSKKEIKETDDKTTVDYQPLCLDPKLSSYERFLVDQINEGLNEMAIKNEAKDKNKDSKK